MSHFTHSADEFFATPCKRVLQKSERGRRESVQNSTCMLIEGSFTLQLTILQSRRLTQVLRRGFVNILKTPALLAMFSKDPISMSYTLTAIRTMAVLEPTLLMPELLERAYNGLEVVNETHRTTAVLSMLLGISRPLVTEKIWLGGQKHLLPLLELCIPGIDLVR